MKHFKIALAGNPNSGKTTIFNQLTGARQHVGNYPGVTVERKSGSFNCGEFRIEAIDLPGTYSLSASSPEELIARDELASGNIDLAVNVVDASNLERNLYLTLQLLELGVPVLLVMNMTDTAKEAGIEFDIPLLERMFSLEIVETVGHRGGGLDRLKEKIADIAAGKSIFEGVNIRYGEEIDTVVDNLTELIRANQVKSDKYPDSFLAVKLLEKDHEIRRELGPHTELLDTAGKMIAELEHHLERPSEIALAEGRYGFISGACHEAMHLTALKRQNMSDHIDSIVTNRVLGIPIFLVMMYLVFKLTFTLGDPFMGWIEEGFGALAEWISSFWTPGSDSLIRSLLVDGIIGGVGGVLVFLPNILLLFLAIAFLEGTGYMARAAFLMDRVMHRIGLHGKSFIPMLIGFGCSVPAIMATRTLESRRDRLTTMMVAPLMSCGARLPIYTLIIPAFFPKQYHALMMWIIYLCGIVLAVLCANLLRRTLLKGKNEVFVMELPPYRMPTFKSLVLHMWERGSLYLRKAGTFILVASIILWAMTTFPKKTNFSVDYDQKIAAVEQGNADSESKETAVAELQNQRQAEALNYTVSGRIGKAMESALKPLGFDWKIGTALIGAFAAKEIFVSQLGIVYSVGEADESSATLQQKLQENYSPLQGFCIMLFCLISAPCMATIAVTRRESNSWFWALFQLTGLTALAYVVTLIVFQLGSLLGIGT